MALRKGAEAVNTAATRSSRNFVPDLRWEAGETKYVQFLHPMSDVTTALMHPFIIVAKREDDSIIPDKFISRRDPGLDGADGYDPLIDRFGETPVNKCIGLAVTLEPETKNVNGRKKITGFTVETRQYETKDGDTKEVPNVGLLIQSPSNFYSHLSALDDIDPIEEKVFSIKRTGKSTDTTYTIAPVGDAIDIEGTGVDEFCEEFDFEAYLEDLASEEKIRRLIDVLPNDWVVNQFSEKNKKKGKPAAGGTTRRRKVEPEDEAVTEAEAEDTPDDQALAEAETTEAEVKPQVKTRRFAALRAELETDQ